MIYKNYKIVATFKYGRIWSEKIYVFLNAFFYPFALLFLALLIWTGLTADIPMEGRVFMFICAPIIAVCFALVPLLVGRNRKWAKKCLKDSVKLTAVAKLFDEDVATGRGYKGVKLFIGFRYNSRKIRKHSTWDIYFKRFADKEITILYSPTYDEILICE